MHKIFNDTNIDNSLYKIKEYKKGDIIFSDGDICNSVGFLEKGEISIVTNTYQENEYEIKISPLHHSEQNPLNLICIPQWIKELDGNTYIGFEIQYSPDANRLNNFIQKLEEIATSFEGVEKSYAIQAGREIRVIVSPDKVGDDDMILKARQICKKIEDELDYPGQIKVNIIRETRATDVAK